MPLQLQIIAIAFAAYYFILTVRLVKTDKAETYQMNKWLILALVIVVGALFPDLGTWVAHIFGITTLTSLALFLLTGFLLVVSLSYQISISEKQKQLKKLTQEISLLNKKIY